MWLLKSMRCSQLNGAKNTTLLKKLQKNKYAPCSCCDNTGKVTIKGVKYTCPKCKGDWRGKEIVGTTFSYYVAKWQLKNIVVKHFTRNEINLCFFRTNSNKGDGWNSLEVSDKNFHDMVSKEWGGSAKIYNDYKEALAEVKRLNAAEKVKGDVQT